MVGVGGASAVFDGTVGAGGSAHFIPKMGDLEFSALQSHHKPGKVSLLILFSHELGHFCQTASGVVGLLQFMQKGKFCCPHPSENATEVSWGVLSGEKFNVTRGLRDTTRVKALFHL